MRPVSTHRWTRIEVVLCLSLITPAASADAVWLAQQHGAMALVYAHGAESGAYDPQKLTAIKAYDAHRKTVPLLLDKGPTHVVLQSTEATVVTIEFDNGPWTRGADGVWVNKPRSLVPGHTASGLYYKYSVNLLKPGATVGKPYGLPLEVVALRDPYHLAAGALLPIRVFADGKPLAGARVTADYANMVDTTTGTSGSDGTAVVRIRNEGLNVIAVSTTHRTPNNPKADEIDRVSTLAFTLPHRPD